MKYDKSMKYMINRQPRFLEAVVKNLSRKLPGLAMEICEKF